MNRMSISAATIALALFGLMSVGWAGEMKAKMEEMKGDTKAKVEEMKGEAKAAVEEAKGNKVQAEVERAKGKGNAAMEKAKGKVKELKRRRNKFDPPMRCERPAQGDDACAGRPVTDRVSACRAPPAIAQTLRCRYNPPRSSPADGCGLTDARMTPCSYPS